jgi:ankyrin repeat protein
MISKTGMTELVKRFAWRDVARGLDENPKLLGHRDERGRNWLHLCAGVDVARHRKLKASDSIALASLLIDRGLGVNTPAFTEGEWQATPLWYAIARGRNRKLAEFLLERGSTPAHCLWAASFNGDYDAMRLLVAHGANPNARHPEGSPFMGAIKWSRFEAAEVLLDLGADIDERDDHGMTALHYMLKKNSPVAAFRRLAARGARGDIPDASGRTAIEILSRKRDPAFRTIAAQLRSAPHD